MDDGTAQTAVALRRKGGASVRSARHQLFPSAHQFRAGVIALEIAGLWPASRRMQSKRAKSITVAGRRGTGWDDEDVEDAIERRLQR